MDSSSEFDLKNAIEVWENSLSSKELTFSDKREFISHFRDSVDDLVNNGLSEEEAFIIAKKRFGDKRDWGGEMEFVNEDTLQLKKIVLLFAGIFIHYFLYNLILIISRTILIVYDSFYGDLDAGIEIAKIFFRVTYFLLISGIVSIFFMHQPMKWLLTKLTIHLKWIIISIAGVIIVVILENYLVPVLDKVINDFRYRTLYYSQEIFFKYFYILIVVIGYLLVYIRFLKKYTK